MAPSRSLRRASTARASGSHSTSSSASISGPNRARISARSIGAAWRIRLSGARPSNSQATRYSSTERLCGSRKRAQAIPEQETAGSAGPPLRQPVGIGQREQTAHAALAFGLPLASRHPAGMPRLPPGHAAGITIHPGSYDCPPKEIEARPDVRLGNTLRSTQKVALR